MNLRKEVLHGRHDAWAPSLVLLTRSAASRRLDSSRRVVGVTATRIRAPTSQRANRILCQGGDYQPQSSRRATHPRKPPLR